MNQPGSFIPRQSPVAASRKPRKTRIYLFSYITYVVFFATLLTVAGLFLWGLQLNSSLDAQKARLAQQRELFKPADIETVRDFHKRLNLVSQVMNTHPAFSRVLGALSETTVQTIKINNFLALSSDEKSLDYKVTLAGVAPNFGALLFQRGVLETNSIFSDSEVVDITYEVSEEVGSLSQTIDYKISATIPVSKFAYDGVLPAAAFELVEDSSSFGEDEELSSEIVGDEDGLSEATNDDSL